MATVLYVNNKGKRCGIYEFGRMVGQVLCNAKNNVFFYVECDTWSEFLEAYNKIRPDVVIYNYHPMTMPWIEKKSHRVRCIQIGMVHEVYQKYADTLNDAIFDYHIVADPTLILRNPLVYKTGRLVPAYPANKPQNRLLTIGSFGFATGNKGFEKIIDQVQKEFDFACIKFNISFSSFIDPDGNSARQLADALRAKVTKSGITLIITHAHLNESELLDFLAGNDLNAFFYDYQSERGISSVTDWALAVDRPIAITKSGMFRHLTTIHPSIFIEDRSLKDILNDHGEQLIAARQEWSVKNQIWDYERIVNDVLKRGRNSNLLLRVLKRMPLFGRPIGVLWAHFVLRYSPWISSQNSVEFTGYSKEIYHPVVNHKETSLNRILDDKARLEYKNTVDFLKKIVPATMARKIPESTVQQAFVFDTAVRYADLIGKKYCRLLAVGAFEDTAALGLQHLEYNVDMIDPNLNYDLETYLTKPNVALESYDVIISTSVIEHVKADECFVRDIAKLLKPGGVAIITCDFHNQYQPGKMEIPSVDFRFYTQYDLTARLMGEIPSCKLIGIPQYECATYDFWLGKFNYTFASMVFMKNR